MSADDFVQFPLSWWSDPETIQLAALLRLDPPAAFGLRLSIWALAASEYPRGVIANQDPRRLAAEIGSGDDPEQLVGALISSGVLGIDADGLEVSGWLDSESGRFYAHRSYKQAYRSHIGTTFRATSTPSEERARPVTGVSG